MQKALASDVIAVMDDLAIDKAHFWGYSFGGYIGIILAQHYPERFHTFIIGGASPQELDQEHQLELLKQLKEDMNGGSTVAQILSFL